MQVIGVQLDIVWEDKAASVERARRLIEAARPQRGALVVLPEMYATGFSMNVKAVAEGAERAAERFLESVAREFGVYVLGGVVNLGPEGRGRNQAVVYSPAGTQVCRYDKCYPFTLGGESEHYTAGNRIELFDWNGMKVAPMVCYDMRFPEPFRAAVRQGAQMFVVIASWPSYRTHHWTTLLAARAIENLAYVVGVNRCGRDPKHPYPGRSMVVDPHGKVIADAGDGEGVVTADVDANVVESWRREFPALADMKPGPS
jgi:predicted amidohydrolase